jgi:hypothetical protein
MKRGTPVCPNFEPADVVGPFATPFLGPVQPVFLEAERLVRQTARRGSLPPPRDSRNAPVAPVATERT